MKVDDMTAEIPVTTQPQPYGFGELFRLTNFYSRQRYWATGILVFIVSLVSGLALSAMAAAVPPLIIINLIVSAAFGWVLLATTVKRLRDAGVSMWWVLLNFVPLVNLVAIVVFGCIESAEAKNTKSAKALVITAVVLLAAMMILPTLIIALVGWQLISQTNQPLEHMYVNEISVTTVVDGVPDEVSSSQPQDEPLVTPAVEPVEDAAPATEPVAQ